MHHKYASQNLITILLCSNKQFLVTIAKYNYMYNANPWLKYNQLRYTTVLLPLYQQHFFKQITLNIFTSKYKTGEKNIKGNLVAKGKLFINTFPYMQKDVKQMSKN